jgi:hypothetical protein
MLSQVPRPQIVLSTWKLPHICRRATHVNDCPIAPKAELLSCPEDLIEFGAIKSATAGGIKLNRTAALYNCCRDTEISSSRKCKFPCCDRRASGIRWRSYRPGGFPATLPPERKQNFFAPHVPGTMHRDSIHADTPARILRRGHHPK